MTVHIVRSSFYSVRPRFCFIENGHMYDSKKELIMAVIARIGRDRPIYNDRFGKIALALVRRYSDGLGSISLLKSLSVNDSGIYFGHGCGRIVAKKYGHDFELYDYDMFPRDEPACLIDDYYTCPGCSKKRNKHSDPAKKEYGFDEYQWGKREESSVVAMECCKKCRTELRRITRETRKMAEIRRLLNQLQAEVKNHVTH
jgi:hypothetical protein